MLGSSGISPRPEGAVWYFDLSPIQAEAAGLAADRPVSSLVAEERRLPGPDECRFLQRVGQWFLTPTEAGKASYRPSWSYLCAGEPGTRPECSKCPACESPAEGER